MKTYVDCGRPGHPARHELNSAEDRACRRERRGAVLDRPVSSLTTPPPPTGSATVALASLGFPSTAEFSSVAGGSIATEVTNPDPWDGDAMTSPGLTVYAADETDASGRHELGVLESDEDGNVSLRLVHPVAGLEQYRDGSRTTFLVPSENLTEAYVALTTALVRSRYAESGADPNRELARLGLEPEVFEEPGFPSGSVVRTGRDGSLHASYDLGLTGGSDVTVETHSLPGAGDDVLVGVYSREDEPDLYDVPELEAHRDADSAAYRVPRARAGSTTRTLARAVIESGAPDEVESWERPDDYHDALARLA